MIAILPIRKNSKRLINKNIKKINNKPLYKYILNTLIKSSKIKKIIISTDYNLKIKKNKKIKILTRPKNLRGNCNMNLVIEDVLNKVDGKYFLQTHATSPLLKIVTLDNAIKYYFSQKIYDSVFSVTNTKKRLWSFKNKPLNHEVNHSPTTQNLKSIYEENSGFYIFSRKSFFKKKNRIGNRPKLYEINKIEAFDIDDVHDFAIVQKILKK